MEFVSQTRYRVLRELAAGGMGKVFEAEQLGESGFRKRVAIKTIRPGCSARPELIAMFTAEARLVADLVHPNIAQIYHFGRLDDAYYIAMELIEGIDLAQFLSRHRELARDVPWELAVFVMSRVARALEYAHTRTDGTGRPLGIVHRDVSPRNIMISSEGEVKLLDFGVAKASHLADDEGRVTVGKRRYMAPEQAAFLKTDARSDLYSLGVVLDELLPQRPPPLEKIVARCLAAQPEHRYPKAGELGYDLEYLIYGEGYGPTIVSLARYLQELFPDRTFRCPGQEAAFAETLFYTTGAE